MLVVAADEAAAEVAAAVVVEADVAVVVAEGCNGSSMYGEKV